MQVCQKPAARQPLHDGPIESTGWSVRGIMSSVDGLLGPNAIALLIVVAMCAAFAVVNARREAAAARSAAAARGGSRGRAASDGSGASLEMRKAAAAAAAARAAAAATTAAAAAPPPIEADPAVLQAMRAFGVEVTAMQDYLHFHPQKILDALRLLHSTTDILIQNQATNPNGAALPVRALLHHNPSAAPIVCGGALLWRSGCALWPEGRRNSHSHLSTARQRSVKVNVNTLLATSI